MGVLAVRLSALILAAGPLIACGSTSPTAVLGHVLLVGSSNVLTQSGEYLLPSGQFRVRLECQGTTSYVFNTPNSHVSGQCSGGGQNTSTVGVLVGPGTALFTITSGSVRVSIE